MNIFNIHLELYFFLTHCTIFYIQWNLVTAKPMIGYNIRTVEENEFPYVVSLSIIGNNSVNVEYKHRCTGTLITQYDVLTAEHCLNDIVDPGFNILLGSSDLYRCIKTYVMWWLSYEKWAEVRNAFVEFQENDIAIVKIYGNVPNNIPVASVADAANYLFYGLEAQIVGWGITNNYVIPRVLQAAVVRILSNKECEDRLTILAGFDIPIHSRRLCTIAEPHVLLYDGDSGGPLLYFGSVIGVNKGTSPLTDAMLCPNKVNLHFGVHYYRHFFLDISNNF